MPRLEDPTRLGIMVRRRGVKGRQNGRGCRAVPQPVLVVSSGRRCHGPSRRDATGHCCIARCEVSKVKARVGWLWLSCTAGAQKAPSQDIHALRMCARADPECLHNLPETHLRPEGLIVPGQCWSKYDVI
jgi:hypothetical protein